MAVSIDWATRVITIPQADLTPLGGDDYELDLNAFRLELRSLEASSEGQVFPATHSHNTEVPLGGVTFARQIQLINGYTVTFEEGQYVVNLVGANSNVSDFINRNSVSIRAANSAGLVAGSGADSNTIAIAVWEHIVGAIPAGEAVRLIAAMVAGDIVKAPSSDPSVRHVVTTSDDDGVVATHEVSADKLRRTRTS